MLIVSRSVYLRSRSLWALSIGADFGCMRSRTNTATGPLPTSKQARLYSVYVFGSYLRCGSPRDLDLLVVYANWLPAAFAANLRSRIADKIKKYTPLPIHAVLLSGREESELQFITSEGCRPLTFRQLRALSSLVPSDFGC